MSKVLSVILVALFALTSSAPAYVLVDQIPVLSELHNMYSPTILGNRLWIGGWIDSVQTEDRIYLSKFNGTSWSTPVENFRKDGWHVNDPSVIQPPSTDVDRSQWLYMYYTALDLSCSVGDDCYMNVVRMAVSTDGGNRWVDLVGTIIPNSNGVDHCGAWSPSALVVGEEIWVYYHGAYSDVPGCDQYVYRTRLHANGWQILDTVKVTLPAIPENDVDKGIVNVDVLQKSSGEFLIVGNLGMFRVMMYTSADGLNFVNLPSNADGTALIDIRPTWIFTPHLTLDSQNRLNVWFGWSTFNFEPIPGQWHYSKEIHKWIYAEQ